MMKLLLLAAILANVTLLVASESSSYSSSPTTDTESDDCSGNDDDDGSVNPIKCGANETYLECPEAQCVPRKCSELGFPISCPDQPQDGSCPGKPGCVCIDGFVKNDKNVCIPSSKCPSCAGDKNKRAGCGVYCNQHCSDIGQEPRACIAICYANECDCRPGFYLNSKGNCVKPDQCGVTPTCKKNEVFSNCTNGGCNARNCSQLGMPVPCVKLDPASCKKGCICVDGYLRNDNGICVPKAQCPPTCKKNEVFSNCTNGGCDARNCSQLGMPVPCVKLDPAACKKGCICVDGYLRNANGTCVPKAQCPSCGGDPNAKPGCGVNCGRRCSTYKSKSPICPKICKVNGCDCKDKYVFDDNLGKCVLPKDCTPTCKVNEVYSNCTNSGCDAKTCSELGFPVPCEDVDPASCKKGCVCKENYVRAKNGTCIPKNECPSCGGDPNARSGCGNPCGKSCSTYNNKNLFCPLYCLVNGCDCKENYVYDNNLQKCVLPKDCTPTCKVNEVFSNCTNSGCDARNCSQLGYPVPCVDVDPECCQKGCVCQPDYLRAKNGTCIPRNECPSCGGDPNAKPGCGVHCGNTCSTYKNKPVACPLICQINGCDCKKNYVYDTNTKKCVLPKDCSKCKSSTTTTTTTTTTIAPATGSCSNGDEEECLTTGNIDFTVNCLYELIKLNAGKSIVMSPFSVFIPVAELALGSGPGPSYNQLMDTLYLNTKDQIRSVFPSVLSNLESQQDAILDLAAKIYVNQDSKLNPNFETDTSQIFGAKAENVDFSDNEKAADIINTWVEEVTRGLIENLVSPSMFSAYTRLVLVNAIYFLGNWQTQFNPNNTQTDDFHITSDNTVQVPMMYRKGSFRYAENSALDCKILEIPYKGGNFSYVILLPNEVNGYTTLAEKVKDPEVLSQALDSLSYQTCQLYLPRHNISSSIDLKDILQKVNITGIFNPITANLNGILEGNEQLSVSNGIQKAELRLNELGTEAAAANAISVGVTSVGLPQTIYTVKANHPYLFFLFLKRNPLFCGAYAGN